MRGGEEDGVEGSAALLGVKFRIDAASFRGEKGSQKVGNGAIGSSGRFSRAEETQGGEPRVMEERGWSSRRRWRCRRALAPGYGRSCACRRWRSDHEVGCVLTPAGQGAGEK